MVLRALALWLLILAAAFANGAVREAAFTPWLGERAAHALSSVILAAAVFLITLAFIRWLNPRTKTSALAIGAGWLLLTLAFEFLAGRYLFGKSWPELMADYDVAEGRLWVVVLASTFLSPLAAAAVRKRR